MRTTRELRNGEVADWVAVSAALPLIGIMTVYAILGGGLRARRSSGR